VPDAARPSDLQATGRHRNRVERSTEPLPHERYLWDSGRHYGELATQVADAWRIEFLDDDGTTTPDTQATYTRALGFLSTPASSPSCTRAHAWHHSPDGLIGVVWRLDHGHGQLDVVVPPGTEAHVSLPEGTAATVEAGRHTVTWKQVSPP
jgi:hypothetical protein